MGEQDWKKTGEMVPAWDYEAAGANAELVGVYKNMREHVGPNDSKLYTFEKDDGEVISLWGSTVIDNRMTEVPLGYLTRVVYLGKKTPKTGGKAYHNFDIFYMPADPSKRQEAGAEPLPHE